MSITATAARTSPNPNPEAAAAQIIGWTGVLTLLNAAGQILTVYKLPTSSSQEHAGTQLLTREGYLLMTGGWHMVMDPVEGPVYLATITPISAAMGR